VATAAVAALAACSSPAPRPDPYPHVPPPAGPPPAGLEAATWAAHFQDDLLPYWTMDEAKGSPVGNFPTFRTMTGALAPETARKPRMMGRQTFAYAAGFLVTGDESLLALARAGNRWILDHARDAALGGWHADLDADGAPVGAGDKFAQDAAYAVMGPAAWFFVTRDPEAEAAILATRDLLFDPALYWDAPNRRIRDGLDASLSVEAYMSGPGSWELVAQLDPATAFLLLVQPVLSDPARRAELLGDLRTLGETMRDRFFADGIFWGTTGGIGSYGSRHTDFGHMLKAHWALTQIDKRLDDHPFRDFLADHTAATLTRALDADRSRWKKRPTSATQDEYGSDWWAYAECDQLAATLALHDPAWIPVVAGTSTRWREDYVDRGRAAREVVPSIAWDGRWVFGWPDSDTAKCNQWKSGFHSAEHALVLYLLGHYLAGTPAPLHFAFPAEQVAALAAASRPYAFEGRVAGFEDLGPLSDDPGRHKVKVLFDQLR
jgi:hypothetical protein